jgi:uncharacterized BrkB/YihY/UPF0761 family membrane protein
VTPSIPRRFTMSGCNRTFEHAPTISISRTQDVPGEVDPEATPRDSRYLRARRRVDRARRDVGERATELEERMPAARAAIRAYEHDRVVGGEIMAGAIAFRAFVFLLPLVLVIVSLLGLAADADSKGAEDVAKQAGIGGLAAQSITESAKVSGGSRWVALIIGLIALYSTSIALARALRIAHGLAWGKALAPMTQKWRAGLVVVGTTVAVAVLTSAISRLHSAHRVAGIVLSIAAVVVYAGAWLGISLLLPHADADWTALLPGAALVGIGVLALHLVTVYYVAGRVGSASSLYGPMGAAVAILGWTYLLGRLTVASAVLNASLHSNQAPRLLG